ncbi:MAG: hypothetical protein M1838_005135 [Thelocarpon superellum]|nr:MAG: hypothetical protein M1838_005135 [Thelocarpon superellum]
MAWDRDRSWSETALAFAVVAAEGRGGRNARRLPDFDRNKPLDACRHIIILVHHLSPPSSKFATWTMALGFILPVRVLQATFALVVLGLSIWIASAYHGDTIIASGPVPTEDKFLIFAGIWTILSLAYLLLSPIFMVRLSNRFAALVTEALTTIFWFAGFIAMAVYIGQLLICNGAVCSGLRAAAAFGGLEWTLWMMTTILTAIEVPRAAGPGPRTAKVISDPMYHPGYENSI